ncbi:hypothetical protein GH714_009894 [Hevea brasiliensis]|uniref:Regulatory protein NPR central domain-containing protein n=1 Tax=Hevea brasiliensis TaxID=3981 RepID=A0A6A6LRI6_HEVBR|nr:hypothetical protein GH714_009894 [Hevea brasiliensis]
MANFSEPSSSLSFTSSSHLSNGSISQNISTSSISEARPSLEVISLNKLSSNLEQLLIDSSCDYSDTEIIVEGIPVGIHRCILAARSSGVLYASSIFQVPELVSLFQRRLVNFVDKAHVEDVIPILLVAFHCQLNQLVAQCVDRIARSDLDNISIEKELPYEVSESIKFLRKKPVSDDEENVDVVDPVHEKRIRRIHKALDSDDVELVKLLLTESDVTLDDANALHYAAAYCDPKVVSEVLGLGIADVNLKNSQGYTVLHIAAMRREPAVIVSLLAKGACALDSTLDGRSAVSICRRLTSQKIMMLKQSRGRKQIRTGYALMF